MTHYLADHWVIGGIMTSVLWYLAGWQSLNNGKPDSALFWQGIGGFIAVVLCFWTAKNAEWLGLLIGFVLLCFEIRPIGQLIVVLNEKSPHRDD